MVEGGHTHGPGAPRPAIPPRLLVILGAWGLVIGGIQLYAWRAMLTPGEVLQLLLVACRMEHTGPLLFIGVATLSPLLLVPAALLGGLAGACFGPALGVLYTLVGCNLSALLTYGLGRISRQEHGRLARLCARYGLRLQRRPLLSMIVLRLSFLPYDPVNYLVGLLHVRLWPFLLGNTLGSLPGVALIVLAGSAVGSLGAGPAAIHPRTLTAGLLLLALSVGLAVVLRRRAQRGV